MVHIVAYRMHDLSNALASVGNRDAAFPLPHGLGDEVHYGGPGRDPRNLPSGGVKPRRMTFSATDRGNKKFSR